MIDRIFDIVAAGLYGSASAIGLTYNEINILVYYLIIPLTWTVMLDVWLRRAIATPILLAIWTGLALSVGSDFSGWCDRAFAASVDFLNLFNAWGGNYVLNSVIICVLLPLIIYVLLAWPLIRRYTRSRHSN